MGSVRFRQVSIVLAESGTLHAEFIFHSAFHKNSMGSIHFRLQTHQGFRSPVPRTEQVNGIPEQ